MAVRFGQISVSRVTLAAEPNSDPEGRKFLSAPTSHDRYLFLHTPINLFSKEQQTCRFYHCLTRVAHVACTNRHELITYPRRGTENFFCKHTIIRSTCAALQSDRSHYYQERPFKEDSLLSEQRRILLAIIGIQRK